MKKKHRHQLERISDSIQDFVTLVLGVEEARSTRGKAAMRGIDIGQSSSETDAATTRFASGLMMGVSAGLVFAPGSKRRTRLFVVEKFREFAETNGMLKPALIEMLGHFTAHADARRKGGSHVAETAVLPDPTPGRNYDSARRHVQ